MTEFSDEHEAFRAVVRDFARRGAGAAHRPVGGRGRAAARGGRGDGRRWGCSASSSPRSGAAAEATSPRCASPSRRSARSARASASRCRPPSASAPTPSTRSAPTSRRRSGSPTWWPACASARSASPSPMPAATPAAPAPVRSTTPDTDEWVLDGSKAFITNSGTPITSIVTVTALTGTRRDLVVHRPRRHAGPRSSNPPTASSAGTPATPTASRSPTAACLRRNMLGAQRQRVAQLPRHPRRRSHRHQCTGRRVRAGVPRPRGGVRQGAPGVRRADRPLPGTRVPVGRPRGGRGEQPQPHLRGGAR